MKPSAVNSCLRRLGWCLAAVLLATGLPGQDTAPPAQPPPAPAPPDRVVALVNRRTFTQSDLDFWVFEARLLDPAAAGLPDEVLRRLLLAESIDAFLLSGWAEIELEQIDEEAADARTQARLRAFEDAAGGRGALLARLEDAGLDAARFREWVRDRIRRDIFINQGLSRFVDAGGVSPGGADFPQADRVEIAHILLASDPDSGELRQRALRLRRDIAAGTDFRDAVRLYSDDPATRSRGGRLGWFDMADLAPGFREAIRAVEPGALTEPVARPDGIHLLRVLNYETPARREFLREMARLERERLRQLRAESDIHLAEGYTLTPLGGDDR